MIEIELSEIPDDQEFAIVNRWRSKVGARVEEGNDIVELKVDEETFVIKAPASGILFQVFSEHGDEVEIGDILGVIKDDDDESMDES
ncbi:MAG: biotin/lipoyl-containing protein [Chlamydiota bacterium]|nr:biotin/lipoyl-containing protein [Chlamydiota bacterium]